MSEPPTKCFTLAEARALLPLVQRLTREAAEAFEARQQAGREAETPEEVAAAEAELRRIAGGWVARMRELGLTCKGLWLVDFDNGAGYYCWHHPEPELEFFHGYEDGFAGRLRIN